MTHLPHPRPGLPMLLVALAALAFLGTTAAFADEIRYADPESCEELTVPASEIISETWTEVRYRERDRGPEMTIPAAQVIRITRDGGGAQARELRGALEELGRDNTSEAVRLLQALSPGGYKQNLESGQLEYRSFTEGDPPGRNARPDWTSEYIHFFYAKALYLEGKAKNDRDILQRAWLAIEDQKAPGGGAKIRTGGFLKRFEGGNSRWYPEAMLIKAQLLVALGRYDEGSKAYEALYTKATSVAIGPRWAYEAKLGPGVIAEARDKLREAIDAYVDASLSMKLLLGRQTQSCLRREYGRAFSLARVQAARVKLRRAEQNRSAPEFQDLRRFVESSTPDALERQFRTETSAVREALVAGARDPGVQAVLQNALGVAYMQEKKFEEALIAFRTVEVKYFQVPEEHARALHYLALAAEALAQSVQGDARKLYESFRDRARAMLKAQYPDWSPGQ